VDFPQNIALTSAADVSSVRAGDEPGDIEASGRAAGLTEGFPADDYDTAHKLCEQLLAGGVATVKQLVGKVGDEFGDPKGVKPKYAVHALVVYAARPGADDQRKMVAETLAGELQSDHSDELKAFVCRQLQGCGRPEEVPSLAKLLTSDRLCEPAVQALLAIGRHGARNAIREALATAEGPRKTTLEQAAGLLSDK
jgi:hypothetical protein